MTTLYDTTTDTSTETLEFSTSLWSTAAVATSPRGCRVVDHYCHFSSAAHFSLLPASAATTVLLLLPSSSYILCCGEKFRDLAARRRLRRLGGGVARYFSPFLDQQERLRAGRAPFLRQILSKPGVRCTRRFNVRAHYRFLSATSMYCHSECRMGCFL